MTLYDAGMSLAVAAVLAPLERLRVLGGAAEQADLEQRLGRSPMAPRTAPARVLIHAVSVGEVAAAGALIAAVGAIDRDIGFVVTSGTVAGREAASRLTSFLPAIEKVSYLPWDRWRSLRGWLERVRPDATVLVEAEIWPNLLHICRVMRIPVVIVNGRIGARDVARYRLARGFFAGLLNTIEWVGVASERDRESYIAIGAAHQRVEVVGNLKVDAPMSKNDIPAGWIRVLEQKPGALIVAGSTHAGENRRLFEAFRGLRLNHPETRLILAPRHPERFRDDRIGAGDLRVARWSQGPCSEWDVLVVDRIGVLAGLYRWADVAFIGGSLIDRGGHNPLEAAAAGAATVIGPCHENFGEIVEDLRDTGGIHVLADTKVTSLRVSFEYLLADPVRRANLGRRARRYLESHRGVADRCARRLVQSLTEASSNGHASKGTGRDTP